ncbi:MAG: Gfo/Idh/MocA family protein, partial [Chloroflexota bacterium]
VGAGHMAQVRGKAFVETGRATIVAVASRRLAPARACAAELGAPAAFDDFRALAACRPEAVLVETPHQVHDEVVPWALAAGYDLLLGGNLATSVASGERFVSLAAAHGRVVECGYDRRYHPAWERLHELIRAGALGQPVQAVASGLFTADPASWYYDEAASGGMPLTHMTYVGLSYIRWLFGRPVGVAALANRVAETAPGRVTEESAAALVEFAGGAFATVIGGYVGAAGLPDPPVRIVCARGAAVPDAEAGTLTLYRGGAPEVLRFPSHPSAFVRQTDAFLDALDRRGGQRNPPEDALWDVRLAAAVAQAARERRLVRL